MPTHMFGADNRLIAGRVFAGALIRKETPKKSYVFD